MEAIYLRPKRNKINSMPESISVPKPEVVKTKKEDPFDVKLRFYDHVLKNRDGSYFTLDSFQSIEIKEDELVPQESFELWRRGGFFPSKHGIGVVTFSGNPKKYVYPLFFHIRARKAKAKG